MVHQAAVNELLLEDAHLSTFVLRVALHERHTHTHAHTHQHTQTNKDAGVENLAAAKLLQGRLLVAADAGKRCPMGVLALAHLRTRALAYTRTHVPCVACSVRVLWW